MVVANENDLYIQSTGPELLLPLEGQDVSLQSIGLDLLLTSEDKALSLSSVNQAAAEVNIQGGGLDLSITDSDGVSLFLGDMVPLAGGESNTASNLGAGAPIYSHKAGLDLRFRSLRSLNSRLSVTQSADTVDLLVEDVGAAVAFLARTTELIGTCVKVVGETGGVPDVIPAEIANPDHYPISGIIAKKYSPTSGLVVVSGIIDGLSGLTPGYHLYTTPTSGVSSAIPTNANYIIQNCGFALTSTAMMVRILQPIEI